MYPVEVTFSRYNKLSAAALTLTWSPSYHGAMLEYEHSNYMKVPWQQDLPDTAFMQSASFLYELRKIGVDDPLYTTLQRHQQYAAASAIFFSNIVEEKGISLTDTFKLVSKMLEAPTEVEEIPPDCSMARREVLQHAHAFLYLKKKLVEAKEPLTETMILTAHKILMLGLVREDGVAVNAGQYRTTMAAAGYHLFPSYASVPRATQNLIEWYSGQASSTTDPFYLASQLAYEFVTIHPFEDGNGRMCRLLASMVLLSHDVPFATAFGFSSGHKQAKKHYMQCIKSARLNDMSRKMAFVILCGFRDTAASFFEDVRVSFPEEYKRLKLQH
jgi:Fic family protein